MKKKLSYFLILLGVILLGGCTSEKSTTFINNSQPGTKLSMTFYYKGDKVTKQIAENTITYKDAGIKTKEQAKELFDPVAKQYQGIDGVKQSIKYSDKDLKETLTVDFKALDYDKAANIPGITVDQDAKEKGVSLKKSKELVESLGYSEQGKK